MTKEELLEIYKLFCQIRKHLEENVPPEYHDEFEGFFVNYVALEMSPLLVFKSKAEYKHAINTLGKSIVAAMNSGIFDEVYAGKAKEVVSIREFLNPPIAKKAAQPYAI